MSGLLRNLRVGVPSGGLRERRESQSRRGAASSPGEGKPGEEPGEVQEILSEEGGTKSIRYERIIFLITHV